MCVLGVFAFKYVQVGVATGVNCSHQVQSKLILVPQAHASCRISKASSCDPKQMPMRGLLCVHSKWISLGLGLISS